MKHKILTGIALLSFSLSFFQTHASELQSAQKLASMGVINSGDTAEDFGLANTITRKEIMKIVMKLSGKSVIDQCNGSFSDVTNDWGCKYIESALSHGFIAANDTFRPNDTISKAEAIKLILKARSIEKAYNTDSWQADYMNTALSVGLIESKYSDHNTSALRGWIFGIGAKEIISSEEELMSDEVTVEETMIKEEISGYMEYSEDLLGKNEKTVLFFHASWCSSCRSADSSIASEGVEDFLLLKTDYDSYTNLRKKYGVTSQHTFVQVDENGDMITKWSGGNTVSSIASNIQ